MYYVRGFISLNFNFLFCFFLLKFFFDGYDAWALALVFFSLELDNIIRIIIVNHKVLTDKQR